MTHILQKIQSDKFILRLENTENFLLTIRIFKSILDSLNNNHHITMIIMKYIYDYLYTQPKKINEIPWDLEDINFIYEIYINNIINIDSLLNNLKFKKYNEKFYYSYYSLFKRNLNNNKKYKNIFYIMLIIENIKSLMNDNIPIIKYDLLDENDNSINKNTFYYVLCIKKNYYANILNKYINEINKNKINITINDFIDYYNLEDI